MLLPLIPPPSNRIKVNLTRFRNKKVREFQSFFFLNLFVFSRLIFEFQMIGFRGRMELKDHLVPSPVFCKGLKRFPGGSDDKESACNAGDSSLILG